MTTGFVVAIILAVAYVVLGLAATDPLAREANFTRAAVWSAAAMVIAVRI
jgi:hypothetical protein